MISLAESLAGVAGAGVAGAADGGTAACGSVAGAAGSGRRLRNKPNAIRLLAANVKLKRHPRIPA
jgi:hypothetical protein